MKVVVLGGTGNISTSIVSLLPVSDYGRGKVAADQEHWEDKIIDAQRQVGKVALI